ncbi:hypothetical protein BY458DRAFT_518974 [Sporodiniella umbellata]|nr:hypothetical protein BY458DRAFT_518974 [Sporodiniella umbellata]
MKYLILLLSILLLIYGVSAESCTKSCSPACTNGYICIVGTMTNEGVCPAPSCMSPSAIGLPNQNSNGNGSSNAGLIGGLVGGLVGGGAILGCVVFFFVRRRNSKDPIPDALRRAVVNNRVLTPRQEEMIQSSHNSRATSGVIPIQLSQDQRAERHISTSTTNSITSSHHHRSISRQASIDSNAEIPQTATVIHATQVTRAKPQIMRVNTVKVQDGVTRSGSYKKTLKPEKENPFDDSNKASSPKKEKPTDSVVSTSNADGEITVVWNGP